MNRTPTGLYTGPAKSEPLWQGLDISKNNPPGSIDWKAGRAAGFRFVLVRAGYGIDPDHACLAHVQAARAADWLVGLYHFPTESPLDEQWDCLAEQMDLAEIRPGDIAPMFDLEPLDGISHIPRDRTRYLETVDALLSRAEVACGQAWIYTSPSYVAAMGNPAGWRDYDLCRAQWGKRSPPDDDWPWSAWQAGVVTPKPSWSRGPLDHDLARFLPVVQRIP